VIVFYRTSHIIFFTMVKKSLPFMLLFITVIFAGCASEQLVELTDCGNDKACMNTALENCQPSKAMINGINVTILGEKTYHVSVAGIEGITSVCEVTYNYPTHRVDCRIIREGIDYEKLGVSDIMGYPTILEGTQHCKTTFLTGEEISEESNDECASFSGGYYNMCKALVEGSADYCNQSNSDNKDKCYDLLAFATINESLCDSGSRSCEHYLYDLCSISDLCSSSQLYRYGNMDDYGLKYHVAKMTDNVEVCDNSVACRAALEGNVSACETDLCIIEYVSFTGDASKCSSVSYNFRAACLKQSSIGSGNAAGCGSNKDCIIGTLKGIAIRKAVK